jgi:hypothetical protein
MLSGMSKQMAQTNSLDNDKYEGRNFILPLPSINDKSSRGGPILNGWGAKDPKADWPPDVVKKFQKLIIKFNKENRGEMVSAHPKDWEISVSTSCTQDLAIVYTPRLKNLSDLVLPPPLP